MKEFMFLIRNDGDEKSTMSGETHLAFVKECEGYISILKKERRLIAAQPLERVGKIISRKDNNWHEIPVDATKLIQVGYYHILAKDLEEAIEVAKKNPEFQYGKTASIEVRPVKTKETETGFTYPKDK